jgi:hypothetical protein
VGRRFHVDLTGFTKREVAEIWQVSFATVSNMITRRELRGEKVYRGGVEEWRFTADQIAATGGSRSNWRTSARVVGPAHRFGACEPPRRISFQRSSDSQAWWPVASVLTAPAPFFKEPSDN